MDAGVDRHGVVAVHAQKHGARDRHGSNDAREHERGYERDQGDDEVTAALADEGFDAPIVHHIYDDNGHVVSATCRQGCVHQIVSANLCGRGLGGDGLDIAVRDHAR